VKLLLDEMFSTAIAEQLRARGHDVVSIHEPGYVRLEGASDRDVLAAALADDRAVLTDNVRDFRRFEFDALAKGLAIPRLIYTTNRQFPRSDPRMLGRLVNAIDSLMRERAGFSASIFLRHR
jgi:hypothetical protein